MSRLRQQPVSFWVVFGVIVVAFALHVFNLVFAWDHAWMLFASPIAAIVGSVYTFRRMIRLTDTVPPRPRTPPKDRD
ncbi:hypothetical protein [Marisediminicola sp. LYQ134]|uniref:hypothetical protein n=1 Tax=Marisediminicola sp. LYQ134 TaxID=3391061 RepID=UPI003983935E